MEIFQGIRFFRKNDRWASTIQLIKQNIENVKHFVDLKKEFEAELFSLCHEVIE